MAVRVQLDLSLGSPFAARVARVLEQVVVVVLVVKCLLERNKAFHVCRHLETECCTFHQTSLGTSKQMMSSRVYIHAVTWPLLCLPVVKGIMTVLCDLGGINGLFGNSAMYSLILFFFVNFLLYFCPRTSIFHIMLD